jgi:hypothetical protein
VHRELARVKSVTKLLDEREAADRFLAHSGGVEEMATLAQALGLIKGDIGLLEEFGAVVGDPVEDRDPDTRVQF